MKTVLCAAAMLAVTFSIAEAQTPYLNARERAYQDFCLRRGGCPDDATIQKMLEAKDNARRMANEAQKCNQA